MKKFKRNILKVIILLISVSTLITSCSNEENQIEEVAIENLNTTENRNMVKNLFNKGTKLNSELNEYKKSYLKNVSEFKKQNSEEEDKVRLMNLISEYEQCSDCPSEYKSILIPLFNELSDTSDDNIVSKIEEYEGVVYQSTIAESYKNNLKFALYSFKEAAKYSISEANENKSKNSKRNIGRGIGVGMVSGFVSGCISGAYVGAVVGTVTVPVIGTVIGAVSGCFAAGAFGATIGSVLGGFFAWTN
jgi:uncharacterized membrane protein